MFLVLGQDRKNSGLNGVLVERIAFFLGRLRADRANGRDVFLDARLFLWRLRIFQCQELLKALHRVKQDIEEMRLDQRTAESQRCL